MRCPRARSGLQKSGLVLLAWSTALVGGVTAQQPRFSCWPEFFADGPGAAPCLLSDFDRNGIPDLVCGMSTSVTFPGPRRGLGDGRFQEILIPLPPYLSNGLGAPVSDYPGVADVNGDGYPDILLSSRYIVPPPNGSPMYLVMNQSGTTFTYDRSARLPLILAGTTGVVFGDVEPDGDLDIYVPNRQGADVLLINDGTGYFVDDSSTRLPTLLLTTATGRVAVADVTGDGLPDIVRAGFSSTSFVLVNTGFGVFVQGQVLGYGDYEDVDLVDVDQDGALDVYFSGRLAPDSLWMNHGGGLFVDESAARGVYHHSRKITFADFDDDGDMDAVSGDTESLFVDGAMRIIGPVLLQNNGSGVFTNIAGVAVTGNWGAAWGTLTSVDSTAADFDSDGDMDFVLNFYTIFWGNQKETVTMFNLKRHIRCEPQVARGGVAQVELYADAGHVIAPVLSFTPASMSLGDFGRLMIDPTSTIPLPIAFFASQGRIDRPVPIPNDPAFAGWIVYSQAIDLWDEAGVPKAHLTNVTQFRIQ